MRKKYWIFKIAILSLLIAAGFALVSELFISNLSTGVAIVVVLIFVFVGVFFDIIGVAVATCEEAPIIAMCSKKINGARDALPLIKNAGMVSNICNDVIGDICGIISGAAGAAISIRIIIFAGSDYDLFISVIITAIISFLTITGKAVSKQLAMRKNKEIVMLVGRFINLFKSGKIHNEKKN